MQPGASPANQTSPDRGRHGPPAVQIQLQLRLPLIWLAFLLAAAILLPDQVWNTLLIGLGGLFLVAYLWARSLAAGLRASRQLLFSWVSVGDRLEERFTLINSSLLPALWVEIVDHSNVPGYRAGVVRSVDNHSQDQWRQSAVCQRRGQFNLGPWQLRSGDPFGIFQVTHHYPEAAEIIIHPPIHGRLPIPLPVGQSSGQIRFPRHSFQAAANAASVRDYRPQDPLHWIHWPTTARHGALYVRQFDRDIAGDIWLLLDLAAAVQLGQGKDSTEEHAVLLAAGLAARALRQNRAVGLAAYGSSPQVIFPGRGQGQQWKILRALALVRADGATTLSRGIQDLSQIAKRGTTAAIITPTQESDWIPGLLSLANQGIQSRVILLDRPSFGGDGSTAGLATALQQYGFSSSTVRQGEIGQPLEPETRRGHWKFQVTGTGKVIAVETPWGDQPPG